MMAAIAGYFASSTLSVERSVVVYAQPDDVFSYLADLEDYQAWSPWQGERGHGDYIVGGSAYGVGQRAAWTCNDVTCLPGTQEIQVVHEPEFVQADLYLDGLTAKATYALMLSETADESLTILVKIDLDAGGFPYVQRLLTFNRKRAMQSQLDRGLSRLENLINEEMKD